jgi:hypothetical protein
MVDRELHRLAHHYMRRENAGHTLQTTALVNEVYLKLIDQKNVHWKNRAHFFALSAQCNAFWWTTHVADNTQNVVVAPSESHLTKRW